MCKPDTATRTIAIALNFCHFDENIVDFDTKVPMDGDSQLLALVHEITHFDDTFRSKDVWYTTKKSRAHADERAKARVNADSLAAYILGVQG